MANNQELVEQMLKEQGIPVMGNTETAAAETTNTAADTNNATETNNTATENSATENQTNTQASSEAVINDELKLKALNETLGTNYASLSEVADLKLNEALQELNDLRRVKGDYEKVKDLKPVQFHSDKIKDLNAFASATGIDEPVVLKMFKNFQNTATPDPIDAMVLAQVAENPELAEDMVHLRRRLEKKYRIPAEDDENYDADAAEDIKFDLKREGISAIKKINEIIDKVKNASPEVQNEAAKQKQEQERSTWKSTFDNASKDLFAKVPIYIQNGTDSELAAELELAPADVAKYTNNALQYVIDNGLEPNQQNFKDAVINEVRNIYADNLATIVKSAREKAVSEARLEWEKQAHNPSGAPKIETPTETNVVKTPQQQAEEAAELAWKGR